MATSHQFVIYPTGRKEPLKIEAEKNPERGYLSDPALLRAITDPAPVGEMLRFPVVLRPREDPGPGLRFLNGPGRLLSGPVYTG